MIISPAFWLEKAASQGDATAQTKLGLLYLNGRGVAHDDRLGAMWLSKGAEQGQHDAQSKLALLYEWGRGVPRDLNRAYVWRLLSLEEKGSDQSDELSNLARQMTDDDVADAKRRASEWQVGHRAKDPRDLNLVAPTAP
jgi:TPR repeat protein